MKLLMGGGVKIKMNQTPVVGQNPDAEKKPLDTQMASTEDLVETVETNS